jgi:hypothetical protein
MRSNLRFAAFAMSLALSACVAGPGEGEESAVAVEALGACMNTEIACTTNADCMQPCGVGTCEASLGNRCRICAQDMGFVCRASAGACDAAEVCDGVAWTCPTDRAATAGTVCRPAAAGGCDVAESCNGTAFTCPSDAFRASGTECRASSGPCLPRGCCRRL